MSDDLHEISPEDLLAMMKHALEDHPHELKHAWFFCGFCNNRIEQLGDQTFGCPCGKFLLIVPKGSC